MDKFEGSYKGRKREEYFFGVGIDTSVCMDPGEQYGNPDGDFYHVEFIAPGIPRQQITFGSMKQIQEFHAQIGKYLEEERHRALRDWREDRMEEMQLKNLSVKHTGTHKTKNAGKGARGKR